MFKLDKKNNKYKLILEFEFYKCDIDEEEVDNRMRILFQGYTKVISNFILELLRLFKSSSYEITKCETRKLE